MSDRYWGPDEAPDTAIRPGAPGQPGGPAGQGQPGQGQPGPGQPGQGQWAPPGQPMGPPQTAGPAPHGAPHGAPPASQPPPGPPPPATGRRRRSGGGGRGRGLAAGVLVGALVLGGAAGFGGGQLADGGDGGDDGTVSASQIDIGGMDLQDLVSVQTVADQALPAVVKIEAVGATGGSTGSGVFISDDGEILTNYHVVHHGLSGELTVYLNDGSSATAEVVGVDPAIDVALLKVDDMPDDVEPLEFGDSADLAVGQAVVAIGSPYGLASTVTAGIVSTLNRPVAVPGLDDERSLMAYPGIQTDAAINPGNSGGALVNIKGELVGINSANKLTEGGQYAPQDGGSIGIGWAIPVSVIQPVLEQLREGEQPTHAWLGVEPDTAKEAGLPQGAVVEAFEPGSAAEDAGLQPGDIITAVGDYHVSEALGLVTSALQYRPGDEVEITFERDGSEQQATVTMGSSDDVLASPLG